MNEHASPHEGVAAEIRAELARQKISQTTVAIALGVSQAGASRRLSGQTPMDVNDVVRLAELLHVPASRFLPERVA
jgi:transcriptional regulator with XRE-family HTH domain